MLPVILYNVAKTKCRHQFMIFDLFHTKWLLNFNYNRTYYWFWPKYNLMCKEMIQLLSFLCYCHMIVRSNNSFFIYLDILPSLFVGRPSKKKKLEPTFHILLQICWSTILIQFYRDEHMSEMPHFHWKAKFVLKHFLYFALFAKFTILPSIQFCLNIIFGGLKCQIIIFTT